jgi:DNA modification methylase/HJR/Mrr/RecB family endonuclease
MYWLLPTEKQELIRIKIEFLVNKILLASNDTGSIYKKAFIFSGRKSEEITKELIEALTDRNDTIYDPLMGSGTTIYQALFLNRRVIGNDLDNYSYYVLKNIIEDINYDKLEKLFKEIEKNSKKNILELYKTKCCDKKNYIDKLFYDRKPLEYFNPNKNHGFNPPYNIKLLKRCPICQKKEKKFDREDLNLLTSFNKESYNSFPETKFIINSRINITPNHSEFYGNHFTNRGKIALLLLQKEISKLTDSREKDILQFSLVAGLHLAKMTDYKSKSQDLYHLVDKNTLEHNIWNVFENRYKNIKKLKLYISDRFTEKKDNISLYCKSFHSIDSNIIPNGSIDLVITDPPYADQVPYLERNQLFRKWLECFVDSSFFKFTDYMKSKEMIMTNSPERLEKHSWDQYVKDLDLLLKHCSRVLKEEKYCVFFVRPGSRYWMDTINNLKLSARKYGLEPIQRIDVSKKDPTIRKLYSATWSNNTDSIMIFYKVPRQYKYWFEQDEWIEKDLVKIIEKIIREKEIKEITHHEAMNCIKEYLMSINRIQLINNNFLIKKTMNRYFHFEKGNWSLTNNSIAFSDFRSETILNRIYDLVPELIETLLDEKEIFIFNDLMLKLSFYLDNGDKKSLEVLDSNRNIVKNILKNFTIETNNGFIRKIVVPRKGEDRIQLHSLDGYEFEDLVSNLLRNSGYKKVIRVGGAKDRGVDILCKTSLNEGNKRVAVQCKRWKADVGSTAIQRLHSYGVTENIDILICITTSGFTKEGESVANITKVKMIPKDKLILWLEKIFPGKYYIGK